MRRLNVLLVARTDALAGRVTTRLYEAGHRVRLVRAPRADELAECDVIVLEGGLDVAARVLQAAASLEARRKVVLLLWRGSGLPDGVWATLPAVDAAEQLPALLAQLRVPDEAAFLPPADASERRSARLPG
jgi:hypothetical protein